MRYLTFTLLGRAGDISKSGRKVQREETGVWLQLVSGLTKAHKLP